MSVNEAQLKELMKTAVVEVLEERREFVKEIVEEAMEDIGLARAIEEGMKTETVSRADVFANLESQK